MFGFLGSALMYVWCSGRVVGCVVVFAFLPAKNVGRDEGDFPILLSRIGNLKAPPVGTFMASRGLYFPHPRSGFLSRGHGHLFDRKPVGVNEAGSPTGPVFWPLAL